MKLLRSCAACARPRNGCARASIKPERRPPDENALCSVFSSMIIRLFQPSDLDELRRITSARFGGTAIDQSIEKQVGVIGGDGRRSRKARHIDEDCAANPAGAFVAEEDGKILGY